MVRNIKIVVPFYKNAHLAKDVVNGINACREEFSENNVSFFFINDSPDHKELGEELDRVAPALRAIGIDGDVVTNERNLGFVQSVNRGLAAALETGADVLLLNSDAIMFPGCVREMMAGADLDDMVGFVCPRSNEAGLATLPHASSGVNREIGAHEAYSAYQVIAANMPRFSFVPTAVGFCLLIKWKIISSCGFLDEIYGKGYNEENDYIMRAGQYGYRAVLANKAYCWHKGSVSFGKQVFLAQDVENAKILNARYPEYQKMIGEYFESAQYRLENVLAGRLMEMGGSRLNIAFNLSNIGPNYNGTSEMAINLAKAICSVSGKVSLHFIADEATAEFHGFGRYGYISAPKSDRRYSAVLHIGQPFKWGDVEMASRMAPVNAFYMLDSIAQDCGYLRNPEIDKIWNFVSQTADGLFFISDYSRKLFNNRYRIASEVAQFTTLLPTIPEAYKKSGENARRHILIIGNHFRHKAIPECVEVVSAAFPENNIVVLGAESSRHFHNVTFMKSGMISEAVVEALYGGAQVVVFPSHYEGFGFPLVKGVAYGKSVVVRESELVTELQRNLPEGASIYRFRAISEIPGMIRMALNQDNSSADPCGVDAPGLGVSWEMVAAQVVENIDSLMRNVGDGGRVINRLRQISMLGNGLGRDAGMAFHVETLDDIYKSRSWRITRPLRRMSKFVQEFFPRSG
jgi:GT2 family glycosyltransferase